MATDKTIPSSLGLANSEPVVVAEPRVADATTGALWVHKDYVQVRKDWEIEGHEPLPGGDHRFGDVESWVAYVQRYASKDEALLTWGAGGLFATLDHHVNAVESAGQVIGGRNQWRASHPFALAPEFKAWQALANGQPVAQKAAIERLEDLAVDIAEPAPTDLMALLRTLRASVNAQASAELRPDGTTSVSFSQDKAVKGGGNVDLPSEILIAVRVLVGHVDEDGKPVRYRMPVRLRVSVGDDAKLAFRFSMPVAERVLEEVYADRVALAKRLLGDGYAVLRAA